MKQLLSVSLCALALMLMVSCDTDDDNTNDDPLLGNWLLTEINSSAAYDIDDDGTKNANLLKEIDCAVDQRLSFNNNQTVTVRRNSDFNFMVYVTNGETVFDVGCISEADVFSLPFSQDGDMVQIPGEENIMATLTANKLSFTIVDYVHIYNADIYQDFFIPATFVFTKQ